MILFLDFDGVLHPEYSDRAVPDEIAFCHLPRFEAVLRDFPNVEIVISSTWRYHLPLDALRERFSADKDCALHVLGETARLQSGARRTARTIA